ncbi:MAG: 50S ribosomal protein L18 [Ignavibacteriae bacterium]|nr:50S ribosomal protein L18 [Ignavibacteriota bacterium]
MIRKSIKKRVSTRDKRRVRIRKKVVGTPECPRLSVYRSLKHMYAQLIDDTAGRTLLTVSTHSEMVRAQLKELKGKAAAAKAVGMALAQEALAKNVSTIVFDRNGYLYHGRVKAVADGAREGGLKF